MNNQIKIVVVGAGKIGQQRIAALQKSDLFNLVGVCDSDAELRKKVAQEYEILEFTKIEDIPKDKDQAVVISTPTSSHHKLGMTAIQKGFHTLIEKPLASTAAQASDLVRAAESKGVELNGGFNYPYRSPFQCVGSVLAQAGPIHQVTIHSGHGQFMQSAEQESTRVAHFIGEGAEGPLFDLSIHHVQFGLKLLEASHLPCLSSIGFRPGILKNASVDEAATAQFGAHGRLLTVSASYIEKHSFMALRLTAAAENCTLEASFVPNLLRVEFHNPASSIVESIESTLNQARFVTEVERIPPNSLLVSCDYPDDSWLLHLEDFAHKINGDKVSPQYSSAKEAETAIAMIEEATKAAEYIKS